MKVVVIGGGIIGLMTALELSQAGCEVNVLDSQDLGQAASWAGGGILSPMYPWRYPLAVNQLARYGRDIYQHWQPILQAATGQDIEINPSGMLILDPADFDIGLNWAAYMQDSQQAAQLLNAEQLQALIPPLNPSIEQGLWFSQLANIRNPRLLKTLIAFLQLQPNVSLHAHCAVTKFETCANSNQINVVIDQHGQRWHADHYVMASGAWSGLLSQSLDWQAPVKPIQGQMILFKTPPNWLPSMLMQDGIYLIPRLDGHIVCGSSTDDIGFDTQVNTAIGDHLQAVAYRLMPTLRDMPRVKAWAGLRPSVPDGVPYIGQAPKLENLWLNTGHFRNGLVMAPASARLLKQQMLGETPFIHAHAYLPRNRLKPASAQIIVENT